MASSLVHKKKAVEACLFLCFLGYTAAVAIGELKRGSKVSSSYIIVDIPLNLFYRFLSI